MYKEIGYECKEWAPWKISVCHDDDKWGVRICSNPEIEMGLDNVKPISTKPKPVEPAEIPEVPDFVKDQMEELFY